MSSSTEMGFWAKAVRPLRLLSSTAASGWPETISTGRPNWRSRSVRDGDGRDGVPGLPDRPALAPQHGRQEAADERLVVHDERDWHVIVQPEIPGDMPGPDLGLRVLAGPVSCSHVDLGFWQQRLLVLIRKADLDQITPPGRPANA